MKKTNPEFNILPEWEDAFTIIWPLNFKVGDIFAGEGGNNLISDDDCSNRQMLRRITKIEPLKDHSNHFVVSSILVGAVVSKFVPEKFNISFWGKREEGRKKRVIEYYYGEEYVEKHSDYFSEALGEKVEIYFIATNDKPNYYKVDVSKLGEEVSAEENHRYILRMFPYWK